MRRALRGGPAVPFREAMAVPKQKQSHSRTAKRRAQHKMASPVYNACPTCHEPRRPHRVCANCGSYKGSEVVAPSAHDHDHDH
jgi:large subunit ribosomal protein L32